MNKKYDDKEYPTSKLYCSGMKTEGGALNMKAISYIRHDLFDSVEAENRRVRDALTACHKIIATLITTPEDLCKKMCEADGIDPYSIKTGPDGNPYEAWRDYILYMSETLVHALQPAQEPAANDV